MCSTVNNLFGLARKALAPRGDAAQIQASVFMHELGHHFGLKYTGGILIGSEGYNPSGHHSCMNYYYILSYSDYTSTEWDDVKDNLDNIYKSVD